MLPVSYAFTPTSHSRVSQGIYGLELLSNPSAAGLLQRLADLSALGDAHSSAAVEVLRSTVRAALAVAKPPPPPAPKPPPPPSFSAAVKPGGLQPSPPPPPPPPGERSSVLIRWTHVSNDPRRRCSVHHSVAPAMPLPLPSTFCVCLHNVHPHAPLVCSILDLHSHGEASTVQAGADRPRGRCRRSRRAWRPGRSRA